MPLIKLQTTVSVPDERREAITAAASRLLAEATGKPEQYVMVVLESALAGAMAGKPAACAFADVRGIGGFNREVNTAVTRDVCALLKKELGIAPEAVYITFTDVAAVNWGWNGRTFG